MWDNLIGGRRRAARFKKIWWRKVVKKVLKWFVFFVLKQFFFLLTANNVFVLKMSDRTQEGGHVWWYLRCQDKIGRLMGFVWAKYAGGRLNGRHTWPRWSDTHSPLFKVRGQHTIVSVQMEDIDLNKYPFWSERTSLSRPPRWCHFGGTNCSDLWICSPWYFCPSPILWSA